MKKVGKIVFAILVIPCVAFVTQKAELFGLIGMPLKSTGAQEFVKSAGAYEESRFDDSYYYVFRKKGFDLMMTMGDTIETVFVYAKGADGHRKYKGELPYGLRIDMQRQEVEKLLGTPDYTGGDNVIPYYSGWNNKGIGITYELLDTLDMRNKVHHISFSEKAGN